jgi:perosamine synthetase
MYDQHLEELDWVRPPGIKTNVRKSWFAYTALLAEGLERESVMRIMESKGIPVRGYFAPVHLQPYLQKHLDIQISELPITESVSGRTIALPFHNNLANRAVDRVVGALADTVRQLL